jgi:hypothetical protein
MYVCVVDVLPVFACICGPESRVQTEQMTSIYKRTHTTQIDPNLPFEVSGHEAARTAVAKSMLHRMREDVGHYASAANDTPSPKMMHLSDVSVRGFFAGDAACIAEMELALSSVRELMGRLRNMRDEDSDSVRSAIRLLESAANYIDVGGGGFTQRKDRTLFILRRAAGQAAVAWPEYLFGALLSSIGEEVGAPACDARLVFVWFWCFLCFKLAHAAEKMRDVATILDTLATRTHNCILYIGYSRPEPLHASGKSRNMPAASCFDDAKGQPCGARQQVRGYNKYVRATSQAILRAGRLPAAHFGAFQPQLPSFHVWSCFNRSSKFKLSPLKSGG